MLIQKLELIYYQLSSRTIPSTRSTFLAPNKSMCSGDTIVNCLHEIAFVRICSQNMNHECPTLPITLCRKQVKKKITHLFPKDEKRILKICFESGTVYWRFVNQRWFGFCCQHLYY